MDEKNLKSLYDFAISNKLDIGDYDSFRNGMAKPENRKSFHDFVTQNKLDIGSYDEFESNWSLKKKEPSVSESPLPDGTLSSPRYSANTEPGIDVEPVVTVPGPAQPELQSATPAGTESMQTRSAMPEDAATYDPDPALTVNLKRFVEDQGKAKVSVDYMNGLLSRQYKQSGYKMPDMGGPIQISSNVGIPTETDQPLFNLKKQIDTVKPIRTDVGEGTVKSFWDAFTADVRLAGDVADKINTVIPELITDGKRLPGNQSRKYLDRVAEIDADMSLTDAERSFQKDQAKQDYDIKFGQQSMFHQAADWMDKISESYATLPDNPVANTWGAVVGMAPMMLEIAAMPEIAAGRMLSKYGIKTVPKLGTYMGSKAAAESLVDPANTTPLQQVTDPLKDFAEGFAMGAAFEGAGQITGGISKRLANKIAPGSAAGQRAVYIPAKTISEAVTFGGLSAADEFIRTGQVTERGLETGIGMGIAFGLKGGMFDRGIANVVSKPREMINKIAQSDVTASELKKMADDMLSGLDSKVNRVDPRTMPQPEPRKGIDDRAIEYNQQRLGLPSKPELFRDQRSEEIQGKIDRGEPVLNEDLEYLSQNLYSEYKRMTAMKMADKRDFSIDQINAAQKEISDRLDAVETMRGEQAETGEFSNKPDSQELNKELMSAVSIDNVAVTKATVEDIVENKGEYIEAIDQSSLPEGAKAELRDKINQVASDNDPVKVKTTPIEEKITELTDELKTIESVEEHPSTKKIKADKVKRKIKEQEIKLQQILDPEGVKETKPAAAEESAPDKVQAAAEEPVSAPEQVQPTPAREEAGEVKPVTPKQNEKTQEEQGRLQEVAQPKQEQPVQVGTPPAEPVNPAEVKDAAPPRPVTIQSLQEDLASKRITLKEYQEKVEQVRKETKPSDTAKKLADKVRSNKVTEGLNKPTAMGFSDTKLWNDMLDFIADGIEAGGKVADVIQRGIDYIKGTDYFKNLTAEEKAKHIDAVANIFKDYEKEDVLKERKFFRSIQEAENISPETKERLNSDVDNRFYVVKNNSLSQEQAKAYVDEFGVDQTIKDLSNPEVKMMPDTKNFISMEVMRQADAMGVEALKSGNKEESVARFEQANAVAEQMVKEGTILGRAVQAYRTLGSPERIVYNVRKQTKEKRQAQEKKATEKIAKKKEQAKKAVEQAVDETLQNKDVQQKAAKAKRNPTDPAEQLAKRILGRLSPAQKKYDPIREMVNVLFKKVDETLTPKEKTSETAMQKLKRVLSNKEEYAKTWEQAKEEVKKQMEEKGYPDEVIEEYNTQLEAFYQEVIGKPYNEGMVRDATSETTKQLHININDLIRKHYTVYDATRRTLQDKLIEDLGISGEDAKLLADAVGKEFDRVARNKMEGIVKRRMIQRGGTKKKSAVEDLLELVNMGAFSDAQFTDWYAKREGWAEVKPEDLAELYRLADNVQRAKDGFQKFNATEDLMKFQQKMKGIGWGEIGQAFWYANVLSGIPTHMVNFIANTANTVQLLGVAAARNPKQVPAMIYGLMKGLQRGWFDAGDVLETGYSPVKNGKFEIPNALEVVSFKGGKYNPANYAKFVRRMMVASDMIHYSANKEMREYQIARRELKKSGVKKVKLADIQDRLFNTRQRIEDAEAQATAEGLKGRDFRRRVFELIEQSRPVETIEDAANFASRATFNYEPEGTLGLATNYINGFLNAWDIKGVRPAKFIIPFTNIISNVANNAIDYTPYGFARGAKGGIGFGKSKREYTKEERADEFVKAATGLTAMVAMYALTQPDDKGESLIEITANGAGDPRKNYELRELGWRPYSIRIGDRWISYQYTPLALAMAPIGYLRDNEKYGNGKLSDEDALTITENVIYSTWRFMADLSFIGTLSDFMNSAFSDNPEAGITMVSKFVNNTLKGMAFPNFYSHLHKFYNEQFDKSAKDAEGIMQQLMANIPVVRDNLNDKLNALGDPIVLQTDRIETSVKHNPIWEFLIKNKAYIGAPKREDIVIEYPQPRDATQDEYYRFMKERGRIIKEEVTELMNTSDDISPERIRSAVNNIKRSATIRAKSKVWGNE